MKKFWTAVSTVLFMGGAVTFLFTAEAAMQNDSLAEIARGNMAEIEASNLALQHAQNEQVRQFAQQMVTDHTAAGNELQSVASSKNLTLPAAITDKQKSDMTKLGGLSGADFDREYMKMMVKDHDRMAKLLAREAERNTDADVKAFATKTLPIVQSHLTTARSISDTLKGTGGTNSGNRNSTSNKRSDSNGMSSASNTNMSSDTGNSNINSKRSNSNRGNMNSNRSNSNRGNTNANSNSNNSNVNRL
jgi:putative membrane protein